MDNDSPLDENDAAARLYRPTLMQTCILAAIAILALVCGFYIRYSLVEQPAVGIACQAGAASATCSARSSAIFLFEHAVFGLSAVTSALLNLIRPAVVFIALALFASGLGIVLYNVGLAALSVTLLIFSLARPVPGRD
jgi:hypothetical protein